MLTWLFIIASVVVGAIIYFGMLDEHAMPLACPVCAYGGGENFAGRSDCWYRTTDRHGRVRCQNCGTRFREHADGMLVRDPDV